MFYRSKRKEFSTTITELELMANAAIAGVKNTPAPPKTPAASGIQRAL